MATQAKRISKTVHVSLSSITPHVDDLSAAAKGAEVNEGMKRVAEESCCQYICNHDNFLCCKGDVNMELVPIDGLQLSKLGTERLIKNPQTQRYILLQDRSVSETRSRPPTETFMTLAWDRTGCPWWSSQNRPTGLTAGQLKSTRSNSVPDIESLHWASWWKGLGALLKSFYLRSSQTSEVCHHTNGCGLGELGHH